MSPQDQLLTVDQVARHLTVSKATAWREIRRGAIPVTRIGAKNVRVRLSAVEAYLSQRTS